jgi:hypothetical protein
MNENIKLLKTIIITVAIITDLTPFIASFFSSNNYGYWKIKVYFVIFQITSHS